MEQILSLLSNLAKHSSNGKNLLSSEPQVQTKLPPTPVTSHCRMRGPFAVLEATLQVRLPSLANVRELMSIPLSAKWDSKGWPLPKFEEHHSDNLNSCCSFNP